MGAGRANEGLDLVGFACGDGVGFGLGLWLGRGEHRCGDDDGELVIGWWRRRHDDVVQL